MTEQLVKEGAHSPFPSSNKFSWSPPLGQTQAALAVEDMPKLTDKVTVTMELAYSRGKKTPGEVSLRWSHWGCAGLHLHLSAVFFSMVNIPNCTN